MGSFLFLLALCAALVLLPLLLLRLLIALVLLPFKLVGLVFRLVFGILGGIVKVGFGLVGFLFALMAVAVFLVLLPLVPFLLLGGFIWLLARLMRPQPPLRVVA